MNQKRKQFRIFQQFATNGDTLLLVNYHRVRTKDEHSCDANMVRVGDHVRVWMSYSRSSVRILIFSKPFTP